MKITQKHKEIVADIKQAIDDQMEELYALLADEYDIKDIEDVSKMLEIKYTLTGKPS